QINKDTAAAKAHLFAPRAAYRAPGYSAEINAYFAEAPKETVTLEILDAKANVARSYTIRPPREGEVQAEQPSEFGGFGREPRLSLKAGFNRLAWNMTYDPIFTIPPRIVMWGGGGGGPRAVPGGYQVRLKAGDFSQTQPLQVLKDPRNPTTDADYAEQHELARQVGGKIKELYDNLLQLRDVRRQASEIAQRLEQGGYGKEATAAAKALGEKLTGIEGELTQLKGEGGQDALNYPGRLDNQWVKLYSEVVSPDGKVSAGSRQRFEDLKPELAKHLAQLKQVLDTDLAGFNKLVREKGAPAVIVSGSTRR
ncbi:MAG: hypothetical protein ABIG68_00530, partial [Acidobacteriota bacterium]